MKAQLLAVFLLLTAGCALGQTWDVSCAAGVPQQVTVQANGHLKAVTCVDSTGAVTTTSAFTNTSTLPSGSIVLTLTSCPSGFSQVTSLDGVFLQGTLAAHGDVGTTGGNATITPSGTVSTPTFTGTSNQVTSAVSAGTPAGTNSTTTTGGTAISATSTTAVVVTTGSGNNVAAETHTHPSHTHTVPAETFTGSAMSTHTHTLTPSGTVSQPTFTGNAIDPRPQFVKVIFCSAN